MKGPRNKLKILTVSDMVHQFQHDANIICSQSKSVFFKAGPDEIPGPCQKLFFNCKILIEVSKQLQKLNKDIQEDLLN